MNNVIKKKGGFLPTQEQIMLLKASLFKPEQAIVHWREWLSIKNFDKLNIASETTLSIITDQIDAGSKRLLPLVYQNLKELNDPIIPLLKGLHRYSWLLNQRIADQTLKVIGLLKENNIDSVLLKGLPIAACYYKDMGSRMMSDADILVPFDKGKKALDIILNSPFFKNIPQRKIQFDKGFDLLSANNINIDLHWNVFAEFGGVKGVDDIFWKNKTAITLNKIAVQSLSPTHQFFCCMVQGRAWHPMPPIRWIADCVMIHRSDAQKIDWEEIIELSKQFHYLPFVKKALVLLKTEFGVQIPLSIIDKANTIAIPKYETLYHNRISLPWGGTGKSEYQKVKDTLYANYVFYKLFKQKNTLQFIFWFSRNYRSNIKKRIKDLLSAKRTVANG